MADDYKDIPVLRAADRYSDEVKASFRIPGHRAERGIPEPFNRAAESGFFRLDLTETPLTDDLHSPEAAIAEAQKLAAEAFGAGHSFFLINGSSCGNESMIMAAAGEGEKIIIPRNSHKSVMYGLIFSGADPVYVKPEYNAEFSLYCGMLPQTVKTALDANPDSKAVFALSPTYHGFCSDLKGLSGVAHEKGIPVLVDEAHGVHYYFSSRMPAGALELGADACVQSIHKTAGAMTQASILHLAENSNLSYERLNSALRMTQSTSPSYPLMISIDAARWQLQQSGEADWDFACENSEFIKEQIKSSGVFKFISMEMTGSRGITAMDPCRVIINTAASGINGYDMRRILWDDYRIDVEYADDANILAIVSPYSSRKEAEVFVDALKNIAADPQIKRQKGSAEKTVMPEIPEAVLTPRKAWFSPKKQVSFEQARGAVSGEMIAPYPPGIPVIYPGEVITDEIFEFIKQLKAGKRHFHGPADPSLDTLNIISDNVN